MKKDFHWYVDRLHSKISYVLALPGWCLIHAGAMWIELARAFRWHERPHFKCQWSNANESIGTMMRHNPKLQIQMDSVVQDLSPEIMKMAVEKKNCDDCGADIDGKDKFLAMDTQSDRKKFLCPACFEAEFKGAIKEAD